jgi:putative transcriptional regulator
MARTTRVREPAAARAAEGPTGPGQDGSDLVGPDGAGITIRLDELLAERGMTLTELSERVGVTVVNLSVLKNGRARAIRFSTLAGLCAALGCQPGDLLSYKPGRSG